MTGIGRARGKAAARATVVAACAVLVLAAIVVATAPHAVAHTPHDSIGDIAVSPRYAEDGTLYTISRTLVLKSTDRGKSWERLTNGLDWRGAPTSIAVAEGDPDRLYATGYFSGVYRSDDAGATWTQAGGNLSTRAMRSVTVSPWDPDLVFAVSISDSALWSSSSGGGSWTKVAGVADLSALVFAADTPGTILAGSERGTLQLSSDTGATWTPVPLGDGAAGPVRAVAVSPAYAEDGTWFVGTESGVLRTTDRGASFTRSTDGLDDPSIMSIAPSPSYGSDETVWVSTYTDGVYESRDAGEHWEDRSDGLTGNEQADLLDRSQFTVLEAAASGRGTSLFLAGFDGLFLSPDGGAEWEELETQPASIIMGVAVSPGYAEDRTLLVTTYINGVLRSRDAGENWQPVNFGVTSQYDWTRSREYVNRLFPAVYSPDYANDRTAFVASRGIVYRSTDGGSHWRATVPEGAIVEGEFPPDYFFIAPSPAFARDRTVLLGTDGGKVFRSDDGGQTYERLPDLGREVTGLVLSPAFATDGTAFVGTPDGVFRSDDRGTSWTPGAWPQPAGPETSIAISPGYATDGTLFAGSAGGLLVSTDRGATWQPATGTAPLARGFIDAVALSPAYADDGTVLVSARGHGVYRSTDGGATWSGPPGDGGRLVTPENFYHATSEPIVFSPAFVQDDTVYAFEGESLFRSTDGGAQWERVPLPVTTHSTDADGAPGPLRETPRATGATTSDGGGHAGHESAVSPNASTDDDDGPTTRQLGLAAISAVGAVAFLWAAERAGSRWRWWFRAGAAVLAFAIVLWLLRRR